MERSNTGEPEMSAAAEARAPADDARATHLGFVAHEIRNPLSTALWTAEMLARMTLEERGGQRGEKLSGMCLRSIARVRQLVEDHFMCERLDMGGLPLRPESVGAGEALDAALGRHPAELVSAHVDPALGVEVDRGLLERALEALVAVAGAERTPVVVSAHATEREVSFHVAGKHADASAVADPVKGSPSDPTGRALAVPLARRVAAALGGTLLVTEGAWLLTLPRSRAYTPRPVSAAHP